MPVLATVIILILFFTAVSFYIYTSEQERRKSEQEKRNTEKNVAKVAACIDELRAGFIGLYGTQNSGKLGFIKIKELNLEKESPSGIFYISVLIERLTQAGEPERIYQLGSEIFLKADSQKDVYWIFAKKLTQGIAPFRI
jgi:hypothetical protein